MWGVWLFEWKIIKYYVLGEDLLGNNADFASLDESLSSLTEALLIYQISPLPVFFWEEGYFNVYA